MVVVIGIQVKVGDDISKVLHDSLACCVTGRVRWAHICWVFSDDVADGDLILNHLIVALSVGDDTQVLVRPCVAGDLVALGIHSPNNVRPACCGIDGALSIVDASNKECSLKTILSELIEDTIRVDIWSVRASQCLINDECSW